MVARSLVIFSSAAQSSTRAMQKLRAGAATVRRSLSFERRRSGSFEQRRRRGAAAPPDVTEPLDAELCLELVAGLHGGSGGPATRRLLAACAGGGPAARQNCATVARAGVAPALVGLLHEGGLGGAVRSDDREDALELLALLTEEPGEGVVHCQLVFVGVVEALLPLIVPARRSAVSRTGSRAAALASRLLLHLACTSDGLEGVLRDGAGAPLAALLAAGAGGHVGDPDGGGAAAARYRRTASFVLQFHQRLSSERLIEFATDPDYAAVLQAVRAAPAEVGECASGERQAAERPGAASVTPAPSKAAGAAAGATAQVDAEYPPGARLGKGDGTGAECRTVAEVPTLAEARASSAAGASTASATGSTNPSENRNAAHDGASSADSILNRPLSLPAYWEIAVSRSTGRRYFVNAITGESQYEVPDDRDEVVTKHYAAQIIQQAWRRVAHLTHSAGRTGGRIVQPGHDSKEVGAAAGANQIGISWEEVDLTFETPGALGLVFSSETETATKVVTEVVPGKLASQVPELSSAFDSNGKPIPGQVCRVMCNTKSICRATPNLSAVPMQAYHASNAH